MQEFLTRDNLGNFTFLMFIVVIVTEFTKRIAEELIEKFNIKTEYIVFFYSLILSILKTIVRPDVVWGGVRDGFIEIALILFNALVISYFASASYSKITSDVSKVRGV